MTHTILLVPQYWARRASSFLVAAAACLPAPAFAADLAVPPPAFTWTGFYLGANAGGVLSPGNPAFQSQGFGSSAFNLPANGAGAKGSITAGFQAGYNYQAGPAVLGFETSSGVYGGRYRHLQSFRRLLGWLFWHDARPPRIRFRSRPALWDGGHRLWRQSRSRLHHSQSGRSRQFFRRQLVAFRPYEICFRRPLRPRKSFDGRPV